MMHLPGLLILVGKLCQEGVTRRLDLLLGAPTQKTPQSLVQKLVMEGSSAQVSLCGGFEL